MIPDDVLAVLRRYSAGELSAERAAGLVGPDVGAAEIIAWTKAADLPLPTGTPEQEAWQIRHALAVLRGEPWAA
jgi:hypothetical protein